MADITFNVSKFSTAKQEQLLKMLNDDKINITVNTYMRDAMQRFVPMKTGKLRDSSNVTPNTISWGEGLKYGHYQWYGEVYAPNIPIIHGGYVVGWYSPRGTKKHPTGRGLGVPGKFLNWEFGYTTPETLDHWDEQYVHDLKAKTDEKITDYLRRECVKRKLSNFVSKSSNSISGTIANIFKSIGRIFK